jgi:hypothetical protein
MDKKNIAFFEILTMILTIFSFSFMIGSSFEIVSASDYLPTGCCLETISGERCLDMVVSDSGSCSEGLVATSCSEVTDCQKGCCYDTLGGSCTLSSPKSLCLETGGNWSVDSSCQIEQCNIGCCVLGSQAVPSTIRECGVLAGQFGLEKEFYQMDDSQTCQTYAELTRMGACLSDSGDFTGQKECVLTEKGNCLGEFVAGKLCTAPELNTLCFPSQETTCLEDRDEVYYLDDCGNVANVYDSSKFSDTEYWTNIIEPRNSCSGDATTCGNCDYLSGTVCGEKKVLGPKPVQGDYVCQDLNCAGGKDHGESWCVYDYDINHPGPVGSRQYVATCLENEVSLEGCADFNQEICIQMSDGSKTAGRCYPNDWRSCLNANGEGDYAEVKEACADLPQCMMFNDYWGNKSKRTGGVFFAGFNPDKTNSAAGAAGDIGKDSNEVIPYCIPRYTPGFQFWNLESNPSGSSTASYGGSPAETGALCSLGSFTCVSEMERECTQASCHSWEDVSNWECNLDGKHATIKGKDLPNLMAAMNERCRAIGTCGSNVAVSGEFGYDSGFTIKRAVIDKTGDLTEDIDASGYKVKQSYLDSIKSRLRLNVVGTMKEVPLGSGIQIESGGQNSNTVTNELIDASTILNQADDVYELDDTLGDYVNLGGGLGSLGLANMASIGSFGPLAIIAFAAMIGYQLGKLIADNQDWSPGRTESFLNTMTAAGVLAGSAVVAWNAGATAGATVGGTSFLGLGFGWLGPLGIIIAILYIIYSIFIDTFDENKYYIMQFSCEGWEPGKMGDCNSCNSDVRPCSENRCRSLGSNCRYYTDLGEPGTCASISDTWQAIIDPWQEILTEGNRYDSVGDSGLRIKGNQDEGAVKSWEPLIFGITTDKEAICNIDLVHTEDYYSMSYEMQRLDETHHFVMLSQFGEQETLPMEVGNNELYIRCMNFAGETNEAEYGVQFILSDEPDLTPPMIKTYEPENGGYIKMGENSTEFTIYLSEPSQCKINNGFDSEFESMEKDMTCITNPAFGVFGEWPCYTVLDDLINPENNYFIKCLDKPNGIEGEVQKMLSQTYTYDLYRCSEGLEIVSLSPQDLEITTTASAEIVLDVETSGCVNGGEARCYYDFGAGEILFLETDSINHQQVFNSLDNGEHEFKIYCEDSAGNNATATTNITVELDNSPPRLVRIYNNDNVLHLRTDEPARCALSENVTEDCNLEIGSNLPLLELNTFNVNPSSKYYLRCEDDLGNQNTLCQEIQTIN